MSKHFVCCLTSVIFLCLLGGCHRQKEPDKYLVYLDSLTEVQPDSALCYLRSLDVSRFSESDKVYYGLLLTQATDKNYLPLLPCDSLVDVALDYYDEGDGLLRAKALLYKSRIQESMDMPKEATDNCFAGLKELGSSRKELRLKRMLYEDLGGVYLKQNLDEKAREMFKLSYSCDSLLNDEKLLKYSLANIGWTYVVADDEATAKQYLDKALQIAVKQRDSLFVFNMYSKLSMNSGDLDSAFVYIRLAKHYQTNRADSVGLFLSLGELFLEKTQLDSAEFYLGKASIMPNVRRRVWAHRLLSKLESQKGDYEKAYDHSMFYQNNIDSIFAMNQTSHMERLAYKYESELEVLKEREKTQDIIQYAVFSTLILVLLFLLIIQRIHRRKKIARLSYEKHIASLNEQVALQQAEIERSKKDLLQLQLAQEYNEKEIAQKECEIKKMIDEKAKLRNWFFMQTPIYKHIEILKNQGAVTCKEARVLLQSEQVLLKETLFRIYDEYVKYLQSTFPKLTDEDCIYCCLSLCDLDDQTIAYCYGNPNKQAVVQRRFRLKGKMKITS